MTDTDEHEGKRRKLENISSHGQFSTSKITLDIGGTRFFTSPATLTAHSSFFRNALSGRFADTNVPDSGYFVDRSPEVFPLLLDYMRSGKLVCDKSDRELTQKLILEADFYGLDELAAQIKLSLPLLCVNVRGTKFFTEAAILTAHSTFFAKALSHATEGEETEISSNRSPESFSVLLNYMENGGIMGDFDRGIAKNVVLDADFYGMKELVYYFKTKLLLNDAINYKEPSGMKQK